MRNPLSKMITEMEPSGIRRFFDVASTMDNVISLGVGEPDFDTPWHIREEGIYSLEKGRTFYTSNAGLLPLRKEVCTYLKRRFALSYDSDEVIITVGGSEAIDIAFRTMLDPGDEVIVPEPCFVSYVPCITMAGGVPVRLALEEKDEFKLTKEKLLSAITDKTKMVVLPFPNNPTGAIMTHEELQIVADVIKEHDLFVLSDEIYSELSYQGDHVSIAAIPGMKERSVVINGFSKSYAMTGWRLGYAVGPKEIIKQMIKVHQYLIMSAPTTSQYAAIEALRNGDEDVAKIAKENGSTRATASMDKAAGLDKKLIFAIGNAPTALVRLYELIEDGKLNPELIIGVPVGFVNVVQSKELIMHTDVPYIVARGRKGGSNIAACICNALLYMIDNNRG